jgi:tRNA-2-methylthio-N6-dimethylallyladenosine synthase
VPFTRGRQKSRASGAILDECRALIADGAKELVLLGQNVNAYGQDKHGDGTTFIGLLHQVAKLPGLKRLRFITPHPKDFSAETVKAYEELPVLAPRLHLPAQSGSDAVLERMKRRYTSSQYLKITEELRKARPDIAISTDIIVGFPGETRDDFNQTLNLVRNARFMSSFSFCYSDRPGAYACNLPDKVPPEEALGRLEELQELQNALTGNWLAGRVGLHTDLLIEGPSRKNAPQNHDGLSWQGRDDWSNTVNIVLPEDCPGEGLYVPVVIQAARKHSLLAKLA